ncbi:MAG: hypothetical protein JNM69_15700 [Archangium sp.]|nr:hypothetical protein [Archangium sp.]
MQLRLVLATSLGLSSCGADPAFDQCEAQRSAYTCGTTKGLVIDCAAFRGKTCDAMVMETWLRCQLAAHVNACGVDSATGATGIIPTRLDTSRCIKPACQCTSAVCQSQPRPPGEPP